MLSDIEKDRYSRHINLKNFGENSQEKLKASKVLCIGAGGLGSPTLMYLASSGIGQIGIIDFDDVSLSNLQRQLIHFEKNIDKSKVESAKEYLEQMNSNIKIKTYNGSILDANYEELIKEYDIIATCVDDLATRYKINDLCQKYKRIQVSANVVGYDGFISTFRYNKTSPCYECLQPKSQTNVIKKASDIGVFAPLVGILGCYIASEVIKEILEIGNSLEGKIKTISILSNIEQIIKLNKKPNCPCCTSN